MQFIIHLGDPFTLLGIFSLNILNCQWRPLASAKNNSLQILIYKLNALIMNGLPSNLVVCCKTIYFNSLNKLYHLIIYTFHK